MHDLWIGSEGDVLHLDGASLQPPVRGCQYSPGWAELRRGTPGDAASITSRPSQGMEGERVQDELVIQLESSTPSAFAAVIANLERHLAAAQLFTERGLGAPVWLGIQPLASEEPWRSRVYSGSLDLAGNGLPDLLRGRAQLRLALIRRNAFEGGEVELPLTNRNGTRVTGGLAVANHADAGHENFVCIDGSDLGGDLPARLKLELTNTGSGGLRNLTATVNAHSNPAGFNAVLEAETGTGGTAQSAADCSGGGYTLLNWSGPDEAEVLTWLVGAGQVADAGGNVFRYLVRLAQPVSSTDLWLKLRVRGGSDSAVLGETDWAAVRAGESLQELGPLPLPPGQLPPGAAGMPLQLALVARQPGAGGHALAVDSLALLALDGCRRYEALSILPPNGRLVDDPLGTVSSFQPGLGWLATHRAIGAPLALLTGRTQRVTFFQDVAGGLSPIDQGLSVRIWYRPVRRVA